MRWCESEQAGYNNTIAIKTIIAIITNVVIEAIGAIAANIPIGSLNKFLQQKFEF